MNLFNQKTNLIIDKFIESDIQTPHGLMIRSLKETNADINDKLSQYEDGKKSDTEGFDFYSCEKLPQYIRKYFYFNNILNEDYKISFENSIQKWIKTDPEDTIHPLATEDIKTIFNNRKNIPIEDRISISKELGFFDNDDGSYGPSSSWALVDIQDIDWKRACREISIYLFSEENNKKLASNYLLSIQDFVECMYSVGISQWDDELYTPYILASFYNLYDFSKSLTARKLAKMALDWLFLSLSLKRYGDSLVGPTLNPIKENEELESHLHGLSEHLFNGNDDSVSCFTEFSIYPITSNYKIPKQYIDYANNIQENVEYHNTKPDIEDVYSNKNFEDFEVKYHENIYRSKNYYLGSILKTYKDEKIKPFDCFLKKNNLIIKTSNNDSIKDSDYDNGSSIIFQNKNVLAWFSKDKYFHLKNESTFKINGENIFIMIEDDFWVLVKPINLKIERFNNNELTLINTEDKYAGFSLIVCDDAVYDPYQIISNIEVDYSINVDISFRGISLQASYDEETGFNIINGYIRRNLECEKNIYRIDAGYGISQERLAKTFSLNIGTDVISKNYKI